MPTPTPPTTPPVSPAKQVRPTQPPRPVAQTSVRQGTPTVTNRNRQMTLGRDTGGAKGVYAVFSYWVNGLRHENQTRYYPQTFGTPPVDITAVGNILFTWATNWTDKATLPDGTIVKQAL